VPPATARITSPLLRARAPPVQVPRWSGSPPGRRGKIHPFLMRYGPSPPWPAEPGARQAKNLPPCRCVTAVWSPSAPFFPPGDRAEQEPIEPRSACASCHGRWVTARRVARGAATFWWPIHAPSPRWSWAHHPDRRGRREGSRLLADPGRRLVSSVKRFSRSPPGMAALHGPYPPSVDVPPYAGETSVPSSAGRPPPVSPPVFRSDLPGDSIRPVHDGQSLLPPTPPPRALGRRPGRFPIAGPPRLPPVDHHGPPGRRSPVIPRPMSPGHLGV